MLDRLEHINKLLNKVELST